MKKITVLVALLVSMGVARADILVNWLDNSGFTQIDGVTPIAASGNVLAQLIFTATGDIEATGLAGDVRSSAVMNVPNDTFNPYIAGFSFNYDAPFESGFLYIRVFSAEVPTVGDYYWNGPVFATINNPGGSNPRDVVSTGPAGSGSGDFGTHIVNIQIVPEPSTLAFLGIGGLVLAIRRRKA